MVGSKCKLLTLPGLSACTVALDWMHCKYLGSDQYMFGSVMWLLCFVVMPETPLQNLLACWIFISRFYKEQETEHRLKFLNKLSMFVRKSGFPKLRGKAAEIKGFGPALLALWESQMKQSLDVHNKIR